jgi:hypothetical protein
VVRQTLLGVEVDLGDGIEPCETTIQAAGGYVVIVESLVPGANALLVSSYLAEFNGRTAVSDLTLIGSGPAEFAQRMVERMAGETHARACLLDHSAALQSALASTCGGRVSVVISDAALADAAGVWRDLRSCGYSPAPLLKVPDAHRPDR